MTNPPSRGWIQSAASTATPGSNLTKGMPVPESQLNDLQKHLKALIEATRECWTYAIFWHCSDECELSFLEGYYKGDEDEAKGKICTKQNRKTKTKSKGKGKKALQDRRKCVRKLISGVTHTEWFFLVSKNKAFANGGSLPGHAFFNSSLVWVTGADRLSASTCKRARSGQEFGIRTLVCMPSANGVLELGSTKLIFHNSETMNKVSVFFEQVRSPIMGFTVQVKDFVRWSLTADRLPERVDNEIENHGHNSLETQLAGEEKVCQFNVNPDNNLEQYLLSTEGSDNEDNDRRSNLNSDECSGNDGQSDSNSDEFNVNLDNDLEWYCLLTESSENEDNDRRSDSNSDEFSGPS